MLTGIDSDVARWAADHRIESIDEVVVWIASVSQVLSVLVAIEVIVVVAALWFGGLRPVVHFAVVLAAVTLLSAWMKPLIDRPRPPLDIALYEATGSAMPSSHAMITSAIVVAVAMADWRSSERLRRAVLVVGVVGCVLIGAAMIYLNVHWLTDVLVGWALGVGLTWTLMRLSRSVFSRSASREA